MTNSGVRFAAGAVLLLILGAAWSISVFAQQPARPPEYREILAAQGITDLSARLKEFERIKAAYPGSQAMALIDENIYSLKIDLGGSLDAVQALQKTVTGKGQGFAKIASWFNAAMEIVDHPNLAAFDKAGVVGAILAYQAEAEKLLKDSSFRESIPEEQQSYLSEYVNNFRVGAALAYLNAGDPEKAASTLDEYKAAGGVPHAMFSFASAEMSAKLAKNTDALSGYMNAACANYPGAEAKAQEMWVRINRGPDGFEAALEAKQKELPFRPADFSAPAEWKGKTVLAELFTGSECPPCAGTDFGFDGLLESVPVRYLTVLEYHLPIPRPDPMINAATRARRQYYGVTSTPSTFFDGEAKAGGGGGRVNAAAKYEQYLGEIIPRLNELPATLLAAKAVRTGDEITIDVAVENPVEGADVVVVLVEKEVNYKGSNGIVVHKMVVRDLRVLASDETQVVFDLAACEKATDEYLTDFEKAYDRIPNFRWTERRSKIDRDGLRIVVFVQDKQTKKVYNAYTVEVE